MRLFDTVTKVQKALNQHLATTSPLKVDGKKGPRTKKAVKAVKRTAAKATKVRDIALGIGGLTVSGIAVALQDFTSLWAEHGAGISSGTLEGLAAAAVPFFAGLYKLLQQAFPEWL